MGYDLSNQVSFRLLQGRLGHYEKYPQEAQHSEGMALLNARIQQMGGNKQQERMIKDKRRSLDAAVWNSYQAAEIINVKNKNRKTVRALINPNKLKQDYDDKIVSVGYEYGFKCGEVFEWVGTNSYWLIYLQDLTELAYFKGDIRRCQYQISWENENGDRITTYAAIRGPVETKINSSQTHGISLDSPNYSIHLLLPLNEDTLKYFTRYAKFYLHNSDVCWRVEGVDHISTPGILEIHATEYYANETEDDIANGVVGGLIEEVKDPNVEDTFAILGDTFIKVKKPYEYKFNGTLVADWRVGKQYPVKLETDINDPRNVVLKWDSSYSGQFELYYGDFSKTIVVESLF